MTTKYIKIVTKTYISILLEFNCVTQFDTCCTDKDKVTVKFVLDQWVFVLDHRVFILEQWVFILDHRVFVLDQWVFVLDQWVFVLDQWVFVLDHRVFGLCFWVFVFDTSAGNMHTQIATVTEYCNALILYYVGLKGQCHGRYHDFWPKFTKFKL